ncbi:hypothetical protein ATE47_12295 [Chryseobacterium sp. IHB B 17019]|uniref:hypothetical protein n=1 Tax=Chryseobacterium sp. IHB B 17019 TaxID=1721091 RepID=UPI000722E0A1|nr:hypothetical protein [Chryseobacterium sp. IHB B 17019]ALR31252.1 hypothetical protein ATE47_12295 [Chryseobacterium sp. IHB B 17019]
MKRYSLLLLGGFILFSCEKEENKEFIRSNSLFNDITNLKKYNNIQKKDVDTLIKISASNEDYIIDGYLSKRLNKKTGWWNIQDKHNKFNKAKIQYLYFENKEKVNQFIFYKNNTIDSSRSKFYDLRKSENTITYTFCTPKSKETALSGKLFYIVTDKNNEILTESKIESKKNNNSYQIKIKTPLIKKLIIKGLFSEILNIENSDLGTNEIFTEDLINNE